MKLYNMVVIQTPVTHIQMVVNKNSLLILNIMAILLYSYESYISNIPTDMLCDIDQSLYQNYFYQNWLCTVLSAFSSDVSLSDVLTL